MKHIARCVALLLLATGSSTAALAGSVWSPPVRIVALEVAEASGVLRLGVRRSIEIGVPAFDFNPADCLTGSYVDVLLDVTGRSTAEQRQLLNEIHAAFVTSRNVSLYVRDDLCAPAGGRVAAGIQVLN
jgi:hypothetical protein